MDVFAAIVENTYGGAVAIDPITYEGHDFEGFVDRFETDAHCGGFATGESAHEASCDALAAMDLEPGEPPTGDILIVVSFDEDGLSHVVEVVRLKARATVTYTFELGGREHRVEKGL